MRKSLLAGLVCAAQFCASAALSAQEIDPSALDALRERADNVVSVSIGPELLAFANALLAQGSEEEAAALEITEGLEGIQVRVFEFDEPGRYQSEELLPIRRQLEADRWTRIVEVDEDESHGGVWVYLDETSSSERRFGGLAVLFEEERAVTLVNIVGVIDPQDLAALREQFDLQDLGGLGNLGGLGELGNLEGLIGGDREGDDADDGDN